MKIAATKVFADFINKTAKVRGFQAHAELVKLSNRQFTMLVDINGPDWADWDPNTNLNKAICIEYPANFYACPVYFSTSQLCAEFRRYGVKDVAGLQDMLEDLLSI